MAFISRIRSMIFSIYIRKTSLLMLTIPLPLLGLADEVIE